MGKAVYRVSQNNSISRARIALVLPTKSFAIQFILFGIALQKEQESQNARLAEKDLLTYWKARIGERHSLIYVTQDEAKRTCLRNGTLQKDEENDYFTGISLKIEDTAPDWIRSLKSSDLHCLADPVDSRFTTSTHARNVCANSRDFLASSLGETTRALSFLRNVSNLASVTTSSFTRLHSEGAETISLQCGELRLGDIIRIGHKDERLPQSVDVTHRNPDDPKSIWIIDGKNNCEQHKRTTHAGPSVYLITRGSVDSQDIAREFSSQFHRKGTDLQNNFFSASLGCKPPIVEQLTWV